MLISLLIADSNKCSQLDRAKAFYYRLTGNCTLQKEFFAVFSSFALSRGKG